MKSTLRVIIILAIVTVIGIVLYSIFFKNSDTPATGNSSLSTTAGAPIADTANVSGAALADAEAASRDFLALLLNIRSIKLDDSLFANPSFATLQDLSRPINPDTNPGRVNPFAPLGTDSNAVSTQVTTSNPSAIGGATSTLNGVLSIGASSVTRWFEYGSSPSLGLKTPAKIQETPGAFAESVAGLTPGTVYYVKAFASIGGQTVSGALVSWKTASR